MVLPSWSLGYTQAVSPLILGVIASAIAENDDNLLGRAKALLITLVCFTITTFSSEFLFEKPLIFAFGLASSTFTFTMLGAMGSRYGNIAFASLLISIYTMLSVENSATIGFQSTFLLIGALSYGVIGLFWLMIWPTQQIQHNLSGLYLSLARYIAQISEHYYPSQISDKHVETVSNAKENANVVKALNLSRLSLVTQIRKGKMLEINQHFLRIYFIAQDIHERVSALHSPPRAFKRFFFHSDIMFRFRHMLQMQSQACKKVASTLLLSKNYNHNTANIIALDDLHTSITYLKEQKNRSPFASKIDSIWQNLVKIETHFEKIALLDNKLQEEDQTLSNSDADKFKDKIARIISQLNIDSLLFRHAIRLSCALFLGYSIIQFFEFSKGYWILLTILLVCRENYSTTRNRLIQRIMGTFFGLMIGTPLLIFFPDPNSQLVLLVIFGVLYFAFRTSDYTLSTMFITVEVLMSFNQFGNSYDVILPRMLDTLIGCLIAVAAVRYILPDWQAYRMRGIMADAIEANQLYLAQTLIQFRLGKKDNLSYRQARRAAHNKDAQLTQAISNMLDEPGRYQNAVEESFRFLYLNHNMLSHISNLGALRQQIDSEKFDYIVTKKQRHIFTNFDNIKNHLLNLSDAVIEKIDIEQEIGSDINDEIVTIILQELNAIASRQPELLDLAHFLASKPLKNSRI